MSFTPAAWYESNDSGGVLVPIAAVPDQSIRTNGDYVIVPDRSTNLHGAFISGTTLTQGRFDSPELRKAFNLDMARLNLGALEPINPYDWEEFFNRSIPLKAGEQLSCTRAEGAGGAEAAFGIAFLGPEEIPPAPPGPIYTLLFTGTTTLVANTWTLVPLTPSQQIPSGRWAIVGAEFCSVGCVCGRLQIPDQADRPGALGKDAYTDCPPDIFRRGRIGLWGEFNSDQYPQAEYLSNVADTAEDVWLDLVYLGEKQ